MNVWPQGLQSPALPGNAAMGVGVNPLSLLTRDGLLMEWQRRKDALNQAKADELEARNFIVAFEFPDGHEGMNTKELGNGYQLKAGIKLNYSLDGDNDKIEAALSAIESVGPEGKFVAERLVTWTPSLSLTEYRELAPSYKAIIDTVVTIKPGTPTLEIKEPKAKR